MFLFSWSVRCVASTVSVGKSSVVCLDIYFFCHTFRASVFEGGGGGGGSFCPLAKGVGTTMKVMIMMAMIGGDDNDHQKKIRLAIIIVSFICDFIGDTLEQLLYFLLSLFLFYF